MNPGRCRDRPALLPDRRGPSGPFGPDYSIQTEIDDLVALLSVFSTLLCDALLLGGSRSARLSACRIAEACVKPSECPICHAARCRPHRDLQ